MVSGHQHYPRFSKSSRQLSLASALRSQAPPASFPNTLFLSHILQEYQHKKPPSQRQEDTYRALERRITKVWPASSCTPALARSFFIFLFHGNMTFVKVMFPSKKVILLNISEWLDHELITVISVHDPFTSAS